MSYRSRIPFRRLLVGKPWASTRSSSCNLMKAIPSPLILDSAMSPGPEFVSRLTENNFYFPMRLNHHLVASQCSRKYSGRSCNSVTELDQAREVDRINLKFAEAREDIEAAMDSKETTYFDEEAECARDAVEEVLEMYEGLLAKLPESERKALQRSMGLKIEQLKAELKQLDE